MKVHENESAVEEVIGLLRRRGGSHKYRGNWRVTRLVCCPRSAYWWRINTPWFPDDPVSLELTFTRGKAHHGILEVYPDKEKKLKLDDITGHYDMKKDRVVEIFTTTLGLNRIKNPIDAATVFRIKTNQLKCYLKMEGGTEGDLMIFYLFGDYSRPIKPQLKVYTMEFEKNELNTHWKGILNRREDLEWRVSAKEPPEEVGEPYECINCGYKYKCIKWLQERYDMTIVELMEELRNGDVIL